MQVVALVVLHMTRNRDPQRPSIGQRKFRHRLAQELTGTIISYSC